MEKSLADGLFIRSYTGGAAIDISPVKPFTCEADGSGVYYRGTGLPAG
jgi:hypothetical protein